jgi:hypothetical protein
MGGHADKEQHFEHKNNGSAQVGHHVCEITQPSFGDEMIRDEVETEQYHQAIR